MPNNRSDRRQNQSDDGRHIAQPCRRALRIEFAKQHQCWIVIHECDRYDSGYDHAEPDTKNVYRIVLHKNIEFHDRVNCHV